MSEHPVPDAGRRLLLAACVLVIVAHAALVGIRVTAPTDLLTRDQERVATYVLDITQNGSWVVQHDVWGAVASKPPVFNWLAATAVLAYGDAVRIAISWPSWMATLITTLLVFGVARRAGGGAASVGAWAGLLYLFSQLGLRQVLLVRTDSVFQLCTFLGALAAWTAWTSGGRRGWTWFWAALVVGTMTKAPHVALFASGGLLAVLWQGPGARTGLRSGGWKPHLLGASWLAAGIVWFVAAIATGGQPVVDKLLGDELAGHVVGDHGQPLGFGLLLVPAWFLTRLAPMSLLFVVAAWRIVRGRPGLADASSERYWLLQVLVLVVLVGLGSKARFVHLLPAMPAAAILAGLELHRLAGRGVPRRVATVVGAAVFAVVGALGSFLYLHVLDAKSPPLAAGEGLHAFASEVERGGIDPRAALRVYLPAEEIVRVGARVPRTGALQFWWNMMPPPLDSPAEASRWLSVDRRGIVVADADRLDLDLVRPDLVRVDLGGAERERFVGGASDVGVWVPRGTHLRAAPPADQDASALWWFAWLGGSGLIVLAVAAAQCRDRP